MFGTTKKDPLVDAVAKVMKENETRRQVERSLNDEIGIYSRNVLTSQQKPEYERVLAERTAVALNEELKGNQTKIDANKNNKIDAQDFKILKAKKGQMEEESESAEKKMEKGEESKEASSMEEEAEQIDEISSKLARSYLHKSIKDTDKPHPKGGYRLGNPKERAQFDKKTRRFDSQALAKSKLTGLSTRKTGDDDYVKAKVLTKEEAEQIDELSKKTLGSYVKKASHDVATKSAATGRYAERANKEEDDRKKTGDYSGYRQGRKDNETADKMFGKSWKRRQGIAKAVDKMTKEETINEISAKVKAAYARKADKEVTRTNTMGVAKRTGGVGIEDAKRKMDNRKAGIKRSMSEEENLAEKAPPGDKYERMVKHIKKKYSKDGLTDKEKSIAYATAWKAKGKDAE